MFKRNIEIFGQRSDEHEISLVSHDQPANITIIICDHWMHGQRVNSTHHEKDIDDSMTFSDAEEWLKNLPEYRELESEESLIEKMRAILTPEQLAKLDLN